MEAVGALQAILPKLADMVAGEYKLHRGAKEGIRYIRGELESMQAALDKVSEVPPEQLDPQDKLWATKVRDMSYDIEDTIDGYMTRVDDAAAAGEPGSCTACCVNIKRMLPGTYKARRDIATEIERIKKEVEEVNKRRVMYKVDGIAVASAPSDPRLRALYADEPVGIESSREKIIELLSKVSMDGGGEVASESEKKLKLVSIVGPGGMGKTTLANAVYQKLQEQFDCAAFVSVSLKPIMKKILGGILRQVTSKIKDAPKTKDKSLHRQESQRNYGNTETWSEKEIIDEIRGFLKDKRYLIIIDDIWDEPEWKLIECVLVENKRGSKIITTTRNIDVATSCCSSNKVVGTVYDMEPLSDGDSEQLFWDKVFGKDGCPIELRGLSREILKKCKGWPLAIVAIASLLANKPTQTKDQWHSVCNSINTGLENSHGVKDMRLILSLSYRDMPSQLKPCFLYLSIFPEDHIIKRDDLIWRWIAEDFVHGKKDENLYELGDKYFNQLINRSMIQPTHVDSHGKAQACRVHDLVLDFIISLSTEEDFVTILIDQKAPSLPKKIRRLSLRYSKDEHDVFPVSQGTLILSHVRTLVVFPHALDLMPSLSIFRVLRLLDLENCTSRNIVGVGNLLHLRYLRLSSTCFIDLPEEIGKLQRLMTLDLKGARVKELPSTVAQLRQLVRLCLGMQTKLTDGVGNYPEEMLEVNTSIFPNLMKELVNLFKLRVLEIMVKILRRGDIEILGGLPALSSLDLDVIEATKERLEINGSTDHAIAFPCLAFFKFASRAVGLVFRQGAMRRLERLSLSFCLAETIEVHGDFNLGLENVTSLKVVDVGIDCRCARVSLMEAAEAALRNATELNPNQPTLYVSRHFEGDLLWDGKGEIPVPETMKGDEGARLAKIGPWGGNNGRLQDITVAPRRMESVIIHSGEVINSLAFVYSDHNGKQHIAGPWGSCGPYGGRCNDTILLGPSEFLLGISGTMDRYIHAPAYVITSLTLVTNTRKCGPFGQGRGIGFHTPMQSNGSIVGFFASTGWFVDAIGVYVSPQQETMKDEEARVAKIGPWGSSIASGSLQDVMVEPCRLESVKIFSGEVINSLAFSYSDHNGKQHNAGPWGGHGPYGGLCNDTILLGPSEILLVVFGTMDRYKHAPEYVITSLTLVTNARNYGPFGGGGGIPFHTPIQSNVSIVGFFARTGWFVDAIGVYVNPQQKTMKGEGARVAKIGPWGACNAGNLQDIMVQPCRLESVTICSGKVINSLAFSYSDHNGKQHIAGPWGGDGPYHGSCKDTILFVPSEFLLVVSGTMDRYIHAPEYVITSLTLVTNARSYGPFGEGGGIPFHTPIQRNGSIVGFYARTGWFVDAIGVYFNFEQQSVKDEEEARVAKIGP